jgi:hypothetical protein
MTESSLLPGVDAPNDSGAGLLPGQPETEPTDGGNRRRLMIIGAIAGVIVLAAAAYMLLHKSGGSATSSGLVPHGTPPAATAKHKTGAHSGSKSSKSSKPPAANTVPKTAKQQNVVDPFAPLVTPPVQTSGAPTSTTTVNASTGSSTTSTSTSTGSQSTTTTPGSTTTTGNGSSAPSPKWIQLMSASANSATFDIGYGHHTFRRYHVQAPTASSRQGTVFDKVFALLSIKDGEATVQFGDGTPFVLTTGVAHVT